ncbi:hypothetical protein GCM10011363_22460 [Marivita lacus]|uniref:Uncharacterized protein n=1 Tax=Marivita lacus TaxID=1323742 RepID=A0ABQ1KN97_9RHOB|nr:hypothetical protein [Marivita lacus]GGC05244.1 hypothetical protein GCM10011363_22460 [Marivita lacus]
MIEAPDQKIHNKELVGRRAFGKDKAIFSDDGRRHFKIDVFIDTRPGGLSVDRLGVGEVIKKRITYLDPLGGAMGEKRGKPFRGWVVLSVTTIHELLEATEAEGEENVLHAEIMREEDYPTPKAKRALAFQLCELARKHDFEESPSYIAAA